MAAVAIAVCVGATALDNGFTRPPMGWSALYGAPFNTVNETVVKGAADGLQASGLQAAGYQYVVLDDWWAVRDPATGDIMGEPTKFPSGMKAIADHVHATGAKFGLYSAASERTCGNWTASLFNEVRDAATMVGWGLDYLKYDACIGNLGVGPRARYQAMSRALNATGKKIFYSVEGWNPADGFWGPEVANMWRTGNDIWPKWDLCILNNLYQTNVAAPYNMYSMVAAGTLAKHNGGGFNDGDMLQVPNNLITESTPGLTLEEASSQFKLWSLMKAPLILGVHWSQLATLKQLAPEYYELITNPEMIALNQDPSPQSTLVAQYPSAAQQADPAGLNVTLQECDLSRPDQRFEPATAKGAIQLSGTSLCLEIAGSGASQALMAKPCNAAQTTFSLANDAQLTTVQLGGGGVEPGLCLSPRSGSLYLDAAKCIMPGNIPHHSRAQNPLPPDGPPIASQTYLWGDRTSQIVQAGNGMCLTVGLPNHADLPHGVQYTNNGTLQHEVWAGPLSGGRHLVALFNKGSSSETLTAPPELLGASGLNVRDIVARKNLSSLQPGAALSAVVPSHGVGVYVLS